MCWDNAWAESFNATLKNERVHRMVYPTRRKAINDIASWIELVHKSDASSLGALRCLVFLGQWWKEYCFER